MPLYGDEKRDYQDLWMWRRRMHWIIDNGPCQICSSKENLVVAHKPNQDNPMKVSSIWSRSDEVRERELAKCQVLCEGCWRMVIRYRRTRAAQLRKGNQW